MRVKASIGSAIYRLIRFGIIQATYIIQALYQKPKDLETAVDIGDWLVHHTSRLPGLRERIPDTLGLSVCGLYFPSPITIAAFKSDAGSLRLWLALGAGGVCIKTVQTDAHAGNPRPRLATLGTDSLINSLGLPNKGLANLLSNLKTGSLSTLAAFNRPIGISVRPRDTADWLHMIQAITACDLPMPYYIELNTSCPNLGQTPEANQSIAAWLTQARAYTAVPISLKLSPMWSDDAVLDLLSSIQIDNLMLNSGNSYYETCHAARLPETALATGGGGVTGARLFDKMLARLALIAPYNRPIIATGGIRSLKQAQLAQAAGATLIGMATAVVYDPYAITRLNYDLNCLQKNHKTSSLS